MLSVFELCESAHTLPSAAGSVQPLAGSWLLGGAASTARAAFALARPFGLMTSRLGLGLCAACARCCLGTTP